MATTTRHAEPAAREREARRERFLETWSQPESFPDTLRTIDNIPVATRYMATSFAFFLAGGLLALLMRVQLGTPENTFLDAETYNQLFTMHGTTMMFLFVIPFIEAFANYMLPLILGTRDLPFPRLTALSYWTYLFGGIFIFSSFLFGLAPNGGWFAYPPLTLEEFSPGLNMDFWDIGLSVAEVAAMGAAAEMIVAILRMRAAGMSLDRLPLFAWAMLITGVMIVFAFTPLIVGTAMLELDRKGLTAFFDPGRGGEPLLWQHLFWVFGHPEVYIMFIPAVGVVSHVVQVFARRPIVSYTAMVLAAIATGFISFGLWVHHMFTTGHSAVALGFFAAASMLIAIPNGVQVFAWIATLWAGRPRFSTPLLFVVGFLVIFLLGGLSGVMVAVTPFDMQAHDSYFVVAHFHYVLIGGVLFPLFAGLYYWLPKITGRLLSERLGTWNFWAMFVGFNVAFGPMHVSGLLGMPRRVYTYPAGIGLEGYNLVSTVGAFLFAAGVLLALVNLVWSLRRGPEAGRDPWGADTLEWSEESPPANAQFARLPAVRGRHPMWEQEDLTAESPDTRRILAEQFDHAPERWRGALVVRVLDGRPTAIVHLPRRSVWPFVMSVGFVALFAGLLLDNLWPIAVGGLVTLVAVVGWFWPSETEEIAMTESRDNADRGFLPLAVAGPASNGWWGTIVLLLILGTALFTLVASYFYLSDGPESWPPPAQSLGGPRWPIVVSGLVTLCGLATWGLLGAVRRRSPSLRRAALAGMFLASAGAAAAIVALWRATGIRPGEHAFGSAAVALVGYQALIQILVCAMLVAALLWAWRRPTDERGEGVALNTSLVSFYAVASWGVVLLVFYGSPLVW